MKGILLAVLLYNNETFLKDTRRENAPSNKTQALTKSINMGIWVIGILNQQLLILKLASYTHKFSKKN